MVPKLLENYNIVCVAFFCFLLFLWYSIRWPNKTLMFARWMGPMVVHRLSIKLWVSYNNLDPNILTFGYITPHLLSSKRLYHIDFIWISIYLSKVSHLEWNVVVSLKGLILNFVRDHKFWAYEGLLKANLSKRKALDRSHLVSLCSS